MKRKHVRVFIFSFVLLAFGAGVFYAGYVFGVRNPKTVVVKGIANIGDPDVTADFGVFWEAWKALKELHVDGEKVKDQDLVYGALGGMTDAYDDPNTMFFRADTGDSKKFEEDIKGEFGGIGAEIGMKNDQIVVVAPLKGSPAERAGLKSADKILGVDATSTANMAVGDAVKIIRGPVGTKVTLKILRNGWNAPRDFPITRETIVVPTLDWSMKDGDVAYVRLHNFNPNAVTAFYKASFEISARGARGMILDLRNNPGGFLESAVVLASFFLEKDQVVATERFRNREDQVFKTRNIGIFKNLPIVVLINQGSASASEILAGALRVHRKASLIGEKSFGKGTVQELRDLRDNSRLKITIANWLLPDGHLIEKNGLAPDVEVKITEEDAKGGKDPQFDKALSVLREGISKEDGQ